MAGRSKADTPAKPQPHRFRVSVPAADEAVVAWMELQDNPSLSVRMLIRESIERLGYVDVVNRPVSQLPGRDRPAGLSEDGGSVQEAAGDAPEARPQLPAPVSAPRPRAAVPQAAPAPSPSGPEEPAGEPLDVNDIFSMMR